MASPFPSCRCGRCTLCRSRKKKRIARHKARLERIGEAARVNPWGPPPGELIDWHCKFCETKRSHWLLKEGKRRMHLWCWHCERGYYVQRSKPPGSRPWKLIDVVEAARLYNERGLTLAGVGEALGCSSITVRRRFAEAGIASRPGGPGKRCNGPEQMERMREARRAADRRRILRLRRQVCQLHEQEGLNLVECAKRLGITRGRARYAYHYEERVLVPS